MPRKKKITLSLLAEKSGLSVYTVSKALRGLPGMSEETRKDVIQLAHQLGYLTKEQESSLIYEGIPRLAFKQRRFLFITSSDSAYFYIYLVFQGLKERMMELGHTVDMVFLPDSLPAVGFQESVEKEGILYADGLFITPLIPEHLEALLLELKLPRILLNFPPVGAAVDSVIWDIDDTTRQAVRYLTSNGHSRILYFGNASKTRGYRRRWLAFREAMTESGLAVHDEDHMLSVPGTQNELLDTFKQHIDRVKPTALICATAIDLAWVYYAFSEIGLRIPHDVSLIHLDHLHNDFTPDITRANLLMSETGSRAADRMLWRLANPHLPYEHIRLQCPFFTGNSVRRL